MSHAVADQQETPFDLSRGNRALVRWNLYVGFAALAVAVLNGFAQALNYAKIDILDLFPGLETYYQGLTVHGVLNVLVLTFAFANGFTLLTTARGFRREPPAALAHAAFWTMLAGTLLAGWAMFTGRASVLYTFYPPLEAHWSFYLGLTLLVVSTWATSAAQFVMCKRWRRDNPGRRIPLIAYISIVTYIMWDIASIGVAVEVVGFLLPWSLGLIGGVDALLSRTLFWFTGHPIVYFWLLPVYVSWYVMVPKLADGKLFSDTFTRVVFLLFLGLSIPVGFHHQFTDPGISSGFKAIHAVLTFGVFFPSLATAFAVISALEIGGRNRGGKGLIGWFFKLPWGRPALALQVQAMLVFALGGVTGLINASYNINKVVHNTTFVPGHFHMTVGTAVALSYMGIAYWLIPWLKGRALWGRRIALTQGWLYLVGVLIFARGMISGGLEGMPRRTQIAEAPYAEGMPGWEIAGVLTGVGGTIMFASVVLFFLVILGTLFLGERGEAPEMPLAETIEGPSETGWQTRLDRFGIWIAATIALIVLAYGPFLIRYLPPRLVSEGFQGY